jgi:hypothetical protein
MMRLPIVVVITDLAARPIDVYSALPNRRSLCGEYRFGSDAPARQRDNCAGGDLVHFKRAGGCSERTLRRVTSKDLVRPAEAVEFLLGHPGAGIVRLAPEHRATVGDGCRGFRYALSITW